MSILRKPILLLLLPFVFIFSFGNIGCVSGGFQWTRKWAGFVNQQHIIIRILLYIFLIVVFAVTVLVDVVIFNTMDFWEGRVSDGSHLFKDGNLLYAVHHFYSGDEGKLRNTRIEVRDEKSDLLTRTILITEVAENRIQVYENGKLTAEVDGISSLPTVTRFDTSGARIGSFLLLGQTEMLARR